MLFSHVSAATQNVALEGSYTQAAGCLNMATKLAAGIILVFMVGIKRDVGVLKERSGAGSGNRRSSLDRHGSDHGSGTL